MKKVLLNLSESTASYVVLYAIFGFRQTLRQKGPENLTVVNGSWWLW